MSSAMSPQPNGSDLGDGRRHSPITREILESYLNCKLKGHLKLEGEQGTKSDYEMLMAEGRVERAKRASEKLVARHKEGEVLRDVEVSLSVLRRGIHLILGAEIKDDALSVTIDGLKRVDGPSRLGGFHYVPILFVEGEKVRRVQRRFLELCGLMIGDIQGKQPAYGIVVRGKGFTTGKIQFKAGSRSARRELDEIRRLPDATSPPKLVLNDHCQICEFRKRCHQQAVNEDNLSLLRGIGEKVINKLMRRGISTLSQLSCTFRPRRCIEKSPDSRPHSFALQALAIKEKRVYVLGRPEIPTGPVRIYIDMEGDPERNFVYLIGMIIDDGSTERHYSFWADDDTQEREIFGRFLEVVKGHADSQIFCYGSYELAFLRKMRGIGEEGDIAPILARTSNVLNIVYHSIYFPVYLNGLKDIAGLLGFRWSDENASGLQSIVWRRGWEVDHDDESKGRLIRYNLEDCLALKMVTQFVAGIGPRVGPEGGRQPSEGPGLEVSQVKEAVVHSSRREWCKANYVLPDLRLINKMAYFDYQRERVYIRSSKCIKKSVARERAKHERRVRFDKRIEVKDERCWSCGGTRLVETEDGRLGRMVSDLKLSSKGIRNRTLKVVSSRQHCGDCGKAFTPRIHLRIDKFGHSLKSWVIYEHVAHRASFGNLENSLREYFGLRVTVPQIHEFKFLMAEYYRETYRRLLKKLTTGKLVHSDETEFKVKGYGKGYVWVFTNLEEVAYLYKPSREGGFLHELLDGFGGVLVSDFYTAYDAVSCVQQKCLIHLIRDFNSDLVANPFDEELKGLASDFGRILREIVSTIDRFGLSRKYLTKHEPGVDRFFASILGRDYRSDVASAYQKRFERYRTKLFTFLGHDGVPWNNNNAEHAVKRFAYYREVADGMLTEGGLGDYLVLLSLHQTCINKGISFLKFLVSQERDIDLFRQPGRKKPELLPYDLYPEGYVPLQRRERASTDARGPQSEAK